MLYRPFLLISLALSLLACSNNQQSHFSPQATSSCNAIKKEIHALYSQTPATSHTPSHQPTSITKAKLLDEYARYDCEDN